jgi:branched-chain amino acid transport system ATP-binding protein
MNLIMRLCHRLHVLNQGKTIAAGSADEIRSDPVVVEAYLGSQGAAQSAPLPGRRDGGRHADRH